MSPIFTLYQVEKETMQALSLLKRIDFQGRFRIEISNIKIPIKFYKNAQNIQCAEKR